MNETTDYADQSPAAQARLLRLARFRTLQIRLEHERRQQTSRRRLLALRNHQPGHWCPL